MFYCRRSFTILGFVGLISITQSALTADFTEYFNIPRAKITTDNGVEAVGEKSFSPNKPIIYRMKDNEIRFTYKDNEGFNFVRVLGKEGSYETFLSGQGKSSSDLKDTKALAMDARGSFKSTLKCEADRDCLAVTPQLCNFLDSNFSAVNGFKSLSDLIQSNPNEKVFSTRFQEIAAKLRVFYDSFAGRIHKTSTDALISVVAAEKLYEKSRFSDRLYLAYFEKSKNDEAAGLLVSYLPRISKECLALERLGVYRRTNQPTGSEKASPAAQ